MRSLILLSIIVLCIFSCKDETNLSEEILGTWTVTETDATPDWIGDVYVFSEDSYTRNSLDETEYYFSKDTMFIRVTPTSPYFAHSLISIDSGRMEQSGLIGDMYFTVYSR